MAAAGRFVDQLWQEVYRASGTAEWRSMDKSARSAFTRSRFDAALDWLIALPPAERDAYLHGLTPGEESLLLSVAGSRAASAVNQGSPDELARGVVAAALVTGRDDREAVRKLALLANSARRLGTALRVLVGNVRGVLPLAAAEFVERFASGQIPDLAAIGYAGCWNAEDGFCYGTLWGSKAARSKVEQDRLRLGQSIPAARRPGS